MIPYPELVPVLQELRRVLRPGGTLRLALPDLDRARSAPTSTATASHFLVPDEDEPTLSGKMIVHLLWYGYSVTLFTEEFARSVLLRAGFQQRSRLLVPADGERARRDHRARQPRARDVLHRGGEVSGTAAGRRRGARQQAGQRRRGVGPDELGDRGLTRLGFDVWFVEELARRLDATRARASAWFSTVSPPFGLPIGQSWCGPTADGAWVVDAGAGVDVDVNESSRDASLLVNISGNLRHPELLGLAGRAAYVDLDPGFTQIWAERGRRRI